MKKNFIWQTIGLLILLAALLVGCGTATSPDAEPAAESDNPVTALEPVPEEAVPSPPEETNAAEATVTEPAPESGQAEVGEPVSPVVVDLSEITPQPAEEGENVVMPAPGRPGPPAELVESVLVDLETRLGAARDEAGIQLESSELLNWPDAALGCPAPGMMYATVLTPGYELLFSAGSEQYTYHTDLAGAFVLCIDGRPAD